MHWIALQWPPDAPCAASAARPAPEAPPDATVPTREALGWWALQFTPHVAWVDEALLLEVSGSLRLWGGPRALLRRIHESNPALVDVESSQAAIGIIALAMLRQRMQGRPLPARRPAALPLATLTAARPHVALLSRLGLRTWGDVHALPRAPMVRRFGPDLRRALDIAWGLAPESYLWLTLPDRFDQSLELPARVEDAPALLWAASRLLASLQVWLRARQQGVLAFELAWTLDLKRLDGRELPPTQSLVIRTAEAQQAMAHLRRLLAERLARTPMLAPATWLRLRSLDTAPWGAPSVSFLPEDQRTGDPLHVFIERVGARLGPASVQTPTLRADHRPECMQGWRPAQKALPSVAARQRQQAPAKPSRKRGELPVLASSKADTPQSHDTHLPDALAPTWLLREPLPLELQADGQPCHGGPLRLLTGPRRVEAGWWPQAPDQAQHDSPRPAARDYYIAQNPAAELLWIYRERATSARHGAGAQPRWFLQGLYA
ncbi:DNA polymerase Y family protein [Ottowia sp.]|uniref:Y-family DNA polymerase n=1 Tax=Ottowia sp. TaxID=1898956 RepID=UPI002CE8E0B1|nr:DNA polymerase Y family protein [Ottowia sp.]HOB67453.1 DNA polymerase Y family protein [Ottowia sp.]HPZ56313.1 DNA polymerase Y family protein [Ottowia sp.]HQD47556.1 DNA polymerase Y family protein [Ottowia sp.]